LAHHAIKEEEMKTDLSPTDQSRPSSSRTTSHERALLACIAMVAFIPAGIVYFSTRSSAPRDVEQTKMQAPFDEQIASNAQDMFRRGREIFRYDTLGDEVYWSDKLKLHQAIQGSKFGGVGAGVSPKTALAVGLKVDMDALPADLAAKAKAGQVDLDDPATTLALIKLNSVLGLKGTFNQDGSLKAIGLTCAVCHSTVDDAFMPGIGHRLDGWPNRDLNVGQIVSLAPDTTILKQLLGVDDATLKKVLMSWGPGKFDAELNLDGKAFRPDGKPAATLIPPAFGMAGVNLHTWTGGWGTVTYWNAFVGNLELQGQGTFFDERLMDAKKYPVAAKAGFGNKRSANDMVTEKLAALQFYQLSIPPPRPPAGSFDPAAATRGEALFKGKATCSQCHVPPLFTEPGWNTHKASDIGIDDFQAKRSPDNTYRTAPLRGLSAHMKGGFYHDGRFPTLLDVVNHYDQFKKLNLSDEEKKDLVEFLKSL
jgi:hypothetical protein